ncbi:hypothetical protein ID850_00330 [Xenorhabdus sp. Flor]|uniref:hypothetical protein n=1 Tax=Xenorhabdus cabanillasii TaxID=351673 RepID=UPI001998DCA8|nr:hypothetical protein [Xenorhabdus sp. Flor]MBD2813234.1 hypothetical protein [Xenorhabdus sp. Flor]
MSQNLKNDLVNIALLGVLLFGLMLAQDSGWGFFLAGLTLAIWCFKTFAFLLRRWWLAVPFWCVLTYLCWQISLAFWAGYLFVAFVRNMIELNKTYPTPIRHKRKRSDRTVFINSFNYDYRNHIGFDD